MKLLHTLAAIALLAVNGALAQYDPGLLYDGSGNLLSAGVTPWISDVDSSGQLIGQQAKQIAHGDTVLIAPRVLDYAGNPRPWPTNTAFMMFYQSGSGMTFSNLVWTNSNPVVFPVYHTVYQMAVTGVVYTIITNIVQSGATNAYTYAAVTNVTATTNIYYQTFDTSVVSVFTNISGGGTATNIVTFTNTASITVTNMTVASNTNVSYDITGFVTVTNGHSVTTINQFTNMVRRLVPVQIVDTGRVAVLWGALQDFGMTPYNCWIAAYGAGGQVSQPVRFTMNMVQAPGFGAAIATQPLNWQTWVSNAVYGALAGLTNGNGSLFVTPAGATNIAKAVCGNATNLPGTVLYGVPVAGGYQLRIGP